MRTLAVALRLLPRSTLERESFDESLEEDLVFLDHADETEEY